MGVKECGLHNDMNLLPLSMTCLICSIEIDLTSGCSRIDFEEDIQGFTFTEFQKGSLWHFVEDSFVPEGSTLALSRKG